MPTKEQFQDFVNIRNSGVTNMFDMRRVCELSSTGLTPDVYMVIIQNFKGLAKEFGVNICR